MEAATAATQHPSSTGRPGCLANYRGVAGLHDEMVDSTGAVRPHWRQFFDLMQNCPSSALNGRRETIQRLLRDHGVTYNVYQDSQGFSRPWELDALPVIIAAEDWRTVADGLEQRVRLLNLIVADIYGPQRLFKEGWIPPTLLYANPGYLRSALGAMPVDGRFIVTMGVDLVRTSRGAWMALADRTQAPSGAGYSLENRIIMTGAFHDEFTACGIQRLASYFDSEREAFRTLAPTRHGTPSVVMLTPGPLNETYFEHAFKARYLGFPIVEGADLTVRGRRVNLKSLDGLHRVDVIVRRVDDAFCDPLELRGETALGTPGLAEAWRSGNVALVNGLGAGVVETPAMHPFLPGLCRHLLGEPLKLPSVPTWWCGQKRELEMFLEKPERWVLKRAFVQGSRQPVFMADLDATQRAEMIAQVRAEPHAWVAQDMLELSTTPTFVNGEVQPRSFVWRSFVIAGAAGRCHVMPGGLSRVSADPRRFVITMQSGGISKDTWVIADGPVDNFSLLQKQPLVVRPARPPGGVPSRQADHLFWLGRYAERVEQVVRVARTTLQRLIGEQAQTQNPELRGCGEILAALAGVTKAERTSAAWLRDLLRELIMGSKEENAVPNLLSRLRYNASAARDRLSDDMWRLINRLERGVVPAAQRGFTVSDALARLDALVLELAAFSGMAMENMTHGHGWRFLEIGRRIERALVMLSLCAVCVEQCAQDDAVLAPLLEIGDSTMTYRRLHFARPRLEPVLDLLLLNETNPRSVFFQLQAIGRQCAHLVQGGATGESGREKAIANEMLSRLASLNLPAFAAADASLDVLPKVCHELHEQLEELSQVLSSHYFSHSAGRESGHAL